MPWDALPPHIDQPSEWGGKDDDQHWYTSWRKQVKGWFAYGHRSKHWWAKWRKYPITLFALFGPGESRWENDLMAIRSVNTPVVWYSGAFYLSRIQYWCNWHIQLQWPLFMAAHLKLGKTKKLYMYVGAKRDADQVYWCPAIYIGTSWK